MKTTLLTSLVTNSASNCIDFRRSTSADKLLDLIITSIKNHHVSKKDAFLSPASQDGDFCATERR